LSEARSEARAILGGDSHAVRRLAASILKPLRDNFVERPWGGLRMLEYKSRATATLTPGMGLGEAFELAADDRDPEARAHPSRIRCADGSVLSLPELLERHPDALLGAPFVRRYGACFPLLPKTLDVAELLSVQGHPAGNTEVYVVIDAAPGATIRLGFATDIDGPAFGNRLKAGRRDQQALVDLCRADADPHALQRLVAPWLAGRGASPEALERELAPLLEPHVFGAAARLLAALHTLYWEVLDSLNEIPVEAGQVIHNANPPRIAAAMGLPPSAEVHALGNPEGRELLALEVRRPGPTFRAWDNVRFPLRAIDVDAAIAALNLRRTEPHELIAPRRPSASRPGVAVSVDSEYFRLEHLTPAAQSIDVLAEPPHSLHAIAGRVVLSSAASGAVLAELERGESALVPIGVGAYRVAATAGPAHVVKVNLPDADS
jgi:mannose-6-phosphate isomerase class I